MKDEIREIKIITLGDILKNIETEDKAFMFLKYIKGLQNHITNLQKEIHKQIHTSIVQKKQINNLQKRNSRQRLANQKQQDLILKLQDENQRLKEDKKKAVELLKNKKEKYKNMTDYHQYYVEGYDKAIELTHSSHSGVMLETIKSATIKNCDDLLNILQNGSVYKE